MNDFLAPAAQGRRGRLTLLLGAAPGVGKTHRLLTEGHALQQRGVDVVVAWADPHGRPGTAALLSGLEEVAPRRVEFHGLRTAEPDVDAVLARRPRAALLDDLAHRNPPGFRNPRRHQDALLLREAGIDVIATLGVESVESLRELVEKATGIRVHTTVPDSLLRAADDIVVVDAATEELPARSGASALAPAALAALRELALREATRGLERASRPAQAGSRVMVCLSSLSPRAGALLRGGARHAGRLNTDWFVVYVETPAEAPGRIGGEAERRLLANVTQARELGAEVVRLKAGDAVPALIDFARSHGVGHIVVGRAATPGWRDLLGRSFVERLLREAADLDVTVVARTDAP